jgi:hypothetical protein
VRAPKKLNEYVSAEDAALALEELAAMIRSFRAQRPLVKWFIRLSYWNPEWSTQQGGTVLTGIDYASKPMGAPEMEPER